jgi:hypothetical protein
MKGHVDEQSVFLKQTMGPKDGTVYEYVVGESALPKFDSVPHTRHNLAHVLGLGSKGYERVVFGRATPIAAIHDLLLKAACEGHVTPWGHLLAPEGVDVSSFVNAGGDDRNAAHKQRQAQQALKQMQRLKDKQDREEQKRK